MDPLTLLLIGFGVWILYQAQASATPSGYSSTPDGTVPNIFNGSGVNVVTPTPGRLSAAGIAQLAANAGFQGNDLVTAVAVALAESGGNPGTVGDLNITPGGSIGLWQINLKWHPEYTAAELMDPQSNANAAYAIYRAAGSTFQPWSTFKNGMYTAYLDQAQAGADVVA